LLIFLSSNKKNKKISPHLIAQITTKSVTKLIMRPFEHFSKTHDNAIKSSLIRCNESGCPKTKAGFKEFTKGG
jgi:hypothetical protein